MKLKDFIKELKYISHQVDSPDKVEVQMADCIPVARPIFKDGTVYITDTDPDINEE